MGDKCKLLINIWTCDSTGKSRYILPKPAVFPTQTTFDQIHIFLYECRFFLIQNLTSFLTVFTCSTCSYSFSAQWYLERHRKTCEQYDDDGAKYHKLYPSGRYKPKKSIVHELDSLGCLKKENLPLVFNLDFCVYDIESYVTRMDGEYQHGPQVMTGMNFFERHEPVSMSIASSLPHFEEKSFISLNGSSEFLEHAIVYLLKLAQTFTQINMDRAKPVLEELVEQAEVAERQDKMWLVKKTKKVQEKLCDYLSKMPILGYNSVCCILLILL